MTALLAFLAAAALLAPAHDNEGVRLILDGPAVEAAWLAVPLALIGLEGWRLPRLVALALAFVVLLFAAVNLGDALGPVVLCRPVELWWDFRHVPSLWGLARDGFGLLRAAGLCAAAIASIAALWLGLAWLLARPPGRRDVNAACLAAALLLIWALPPRAGPALLAQAEVAWHAFEAARGGDNKWTRALQVPAPPHSDLAGLGGRDVHLVFIESYGATALADGTVREGLGAFDAALRQHGFYAVTHRLLSPTYGGGSWFAHSTLASGIRVADQLTYRLLLASRRTSLPRLMKGAGYHTIEVVPGMKTGDPDAAFWGFDRIWDAPSLAYDGPPFGWFRIPDQATFKRVLSVERAAPLFAEWVLVSSHVPFAPVPPHVAWDDAGTYHSVDQATWDRTYEAPDWRHLDRPYVASLAYVFATLGDVLDRLPRDAVIILLGDHQPPAFVMPGEDWSVPVHILARDRTLLEPFRRLGYVDGLFPGKAPPRPMERFLGDFLKAFDRTEAAASR